MEVIGQTFSQAGDRENRTSFVSFLQHQLAFYDETRTAHTDLSCAVKSEECKKILILDGVVYAFAFKNTN